MHCSTSEVSGKARGTPLVCAPEANGPSFPLPFTTPPPGSRETPQFADQAKCSRVAGYPTGTDFFPGLSCFVHNIIISLYIKHPLHCMQRKLHYDMCMPFYDTCSPNHLCYHVSYSCMICTHLGGRAFMLIL